MLMTAKLMVTVEPTKQQLVDYMNSAAAINLYAYAITNQNMPVLQQPPKNYAEFGEKFAPAKAHCLDWTNSIFPNILQLPKSICQAGNLFELEETAIGIALGILKNDPGNAKAKTSLKDALSAIQKIVQGQHKVGAGLVTDLGTFATNIKGDAIILNEIAARALQAVTDDKKEIEKINGFIKDLKNDINSQQVWLTVAAIGIIASILVFLGGALLLLIPGAGGFAAGTMIVGLAGMAGSTAGVILANRRIQGDQDNIVAQGKVIKAYNADVVLLQGLNSQFQSLVEANVKAQKAIETVMQMFRNLDVTIGQVITDLTTVGTDVDAAKYVQAEVDLRAADKAWKEVMQFAKALSGITYTWTDAQGKTHDFAQESPGANAGKVYNISDYRQAA